MLLFFPFWFDHVMFTFNVMDYCKENNNKQNKSVAGLSVCSIKKQQIKECSGK